MVFVEITVRGSPYFLTQKEVHAQAITVIAALFGFSGLITAYRLQSIEEARRHEARRFIEIKDTESKEKWNACLEQFSYKYERQYFLRFTQAIAFLFTVSLISASIAYVQVIDKSAFPTFGPLGVLAPNFAVASGIAFLTQLLLLK